MAVPSMRAAALWSGLLPLADVSGVSTGVEDLDLEQALVDDDE
jgi:hypothetical protein